MMTPSKKMAAFLLLAALVPAACASDYTPPPPPPLAFTGKPIKLNVASIAIDDRYFSSAQPPHIEQLHEQTPAGVARMWADTRLVAVGTSGIATLTITDGSVIEEKLPLQGGLTGTFGDQQDGKYKASLRATLTVGAPGRRQGEYSTYTARATAGGEATTLESSTSSDRDVVYAQLLQAVAQKFDAAMQAEIHRTMAPVLVP